MIKTIDDFLAEIGQDDVKWCCNGYSGDNTTGVWQSRALADVTSFNFKGVRLRWLFFNQFYDKHVEQKSVEGVKMNWCIWIDCKLFNFAQIVLCCISITNKTISIFVGNLTVSFFKTNITPSPYIVGIFGSFKGSCQRSQGLKGKICLLKNTDANRDKRLKKIHWNLFKFKI